MKLVQLSDYAFVSKKTGRPCEPFDFEMTFGDVISMTSDSADDALAFLKALATLIRPWQGTYRYKEHILNFTEYKNLLEVKKNIGFITSHAALISNRTIRENLLLMNAYYKNSLSFQLDSHTRELCRLFSLQNKLELRPADLADHEYRFAVTVRELIKKPEILLLEYPENYIGIANMTIFHDILQDMLGSNVCVVFISGYQHVVETFSNRNLVISEGTLKVSATATHHGGDEKQTG